MPKEITAWECEYCHRMYLKTKKSVASHEAFCYWNPKNRACAACGNKINGSKTIYNPDHGGNPGSTDYETPTMYCGVTGDDLFDVDNLRYNCSHWEKQA
jgi:hypothetical protein